VTWQRAAELLESREYEQVARLLREQQEAVQRSGQMTLVIMLAAACQLCLTCQQFKRERELHRRAAADAARREQELLGHIQSLLTVFAGPHEITVGLDPTPMPGSLLEPLPEEKPSFFEKIRRLIRSQPLVEQQGQEESIANGWQQATTVLDSVLELAKEESTGRNEMDGGATAKKSLPKSTPGQEQDMTRSEEEALPSITEMVPQETISSTVRKLQESGSKHMLTVYCLGSFRVYQGERQITDWPSLKGQSILKFLVADSQRLVAKDVLMEVFWPESDVDSSRRNLHQAIYALRQTLRRYDPDFQHIQFRNDCYLLNPNMKTWVDLSEFEEQIKAGRQLMAAGKPGEAMNAFAVAEALYQGSFLADDPYEEWAAQTRRSTRSAYLDIADRLSDYYIKRKEYGPAIALCRKMLIHDNCYEAAHRNLMTCYLAQGQRHLALQQYHRCVKALKSELDLAPSEGTKQLYQQIINQN
jgi:DNA-binding SARP family transcriptional activator